MMLTFLYSKGHGAVHSWVKIGISKIASKWATVIEIEPPLPVPRIRCRRKFPGEDTLIIDVVERFKVEFFYTLLHNCASQVTARFEDLQAFVLNFSILNPVEFEGKLSAELEKQLNELTKIYQDDINMHDVQSECRVIKQQQCINNNTWLFHNFDC